MRHVSTTRRRNEEEEEEVGEEGEKEEQEEAHRWLVVPYVIVRRASNQPFMRCDVQCPHLSFLVVL